MPAMRAATITLLRAYAQKSPGYSPSGTKFVSTRAPWDSEKSPTPKINASSRGLATAISSALARPSTSSMSTSSRMRLSKPSFDSSWVSSTSTHQTSRALRAFGMMMVSRFSPALVTTSIRSSWHHWVSRPLIRMARAVRPQSMSLSAVIALARDSSLKAAGTASSRSRNTRSAPQPAPFSNMLSLLAGTASSERRSRSVIKFFLSQHATGAQIIDFVWVQAEQFAVDLGVVFTEAGAQTVDRPGCRRATRDRGLHRHRPKLFVVDGDEHPTMRELLVADQVADVVDRGSGNLVRLEDCHRLRKRLPGNPIRHHVVHFAGPGQPSLRIQEVGVLQKVVTAYRSEHPQRQRR